ncbi:hypothetical protein EG850_02695 [Gulosibacter macacae]|uniref:Uncharacterized protein n=1 Tax=Gulosibacter macacae TaxID=2488791 RepID=A0A3P3W360_9MICO|nr:hypothetical protein [Gulosibacter macacae]RRJ88366.1 hypothetical protein EG850_02695 [Gulosibacter macacae]
MSEPARELPEGPEEATPKRSSWRMIAVLLLVVGLICVGTLLFFGGNGMPGDLVAPLVGLSATLVLVGGIALAVGTVLRKDIGAGLPDDE